LFSHGLLWDCACGVFKSVKKLFYFFCVILFAVCLSHGLIAFAESSVAKALNWQTGSAPDHTGSLCGGYFKEPTEIANTPTPPSYKTTPVIITAKGPVIFRADGASILQDDVEIHQPGRLLRADKAVILHNRKTGKITDIQLSGNVHAQEHGKLLVGKKADYNVAKNTLTFHHAIYHIAGQHELLSISTPFDAWGTAGTINRDNTTVIHLHNATYSTCAPIHPAWTISATKMNLDHVKGEGTADNVVIRFKKIPIFYTPYYSFPLNAARKSGFLAPTMGYATAHGFYIGEPYYGSIAPNYDLLLTPEWYSERGGQLNGLFRYLTSVSSGSLYASYMPQDREFAQFRQNTLNNFTGNIIASNADLPPYIAALKASTAQRTFIDFQNDVEFNHYWSGKFYARYLSDSYFAEDFQSAFLKQSNNQVPSFAELDYTGTHWQDIFLVQTYQTLHPIDQINQPAQNQYTRLPELDFNASYPEFASNNDFNLNGQIVKFDYQSDFFPYTYQRPIGDRIHLQPTLSHPIMWSSGFITPKIIADTTSYFSELPKATPTSIRPNYDINRTLPIVDIDSGLYFNRQMQWGSKNYIQTLEPRLFYLYTPYLNQNNYPNFDTQSLPFSITNLYSINQFTGYDRIQNANQLSLGLTSDILRASDASDILSAQLGVINYFANPQVCLLQSCSTPTQTISPVAGELSWNPDAMLSVNTQAAWDTVLKQVNNAQVGMQYHWNDHQIMVLNYQFAHGNPDTPFDSLGFSTDSSLITAGLLWPLTDRWRFFGYSYYDITHRRPENQYVGLSYDTCCWATRIILADNYNGTTQVSGGQISQSQYTTTYYIEFLLKGLGSVGNNRAEDMLTSTLPGFEDIFSNRGHYGYSNEI